MPPTPGKTLMELIKDISTDVGADATSPIPKSPFKAGSFQSLTDKTILSISLWKI